MKKLAVWLLAAAVFQAGIYLYINHKLAPDAGPVSVTPVDIQGAGGKQVLFSYDKSYKAEVSKDAVEIYAASNSGGVPDKKIEIGDTEKLTYFSWLQDRNIALAGISKPGDKGTVCTLEPLNMVTDSHSIVPAIAGLGKGAEIFDVAFSTATNVIYIQVKNGNNSTIYRTDANNKLTQVGNTPAAIGRIANLKSEDALLYDSISTGRVYLVDRNGRKQISPADGSQYALIGTDKNDKVYIARLSGGQTGSSSQDGARLAETILAGKMGDDFSVLRSMESPYPVDQIRVDYDGRLLL